MAANEAKIKFNVDVAEMNQNIKKADSVLRELRSSLLLNKTALNDSATAASALKDRLEILTEESETLSKKKEALNEKLKAAIQYFGEDSIEADKYRTQLNNVETQAAKVAAEIQDVNSQLKAQEAAAKEAESSLGKLTAEIEDQETRLTALKKEYVNACLEFGDTSSEAQSLAGEIGSLSGELKENREKLSNAEAAADELDETLQRAEDTTADADEGFTVLKATLANLAADGIRKVVEEIRELAGDIVDLGKNFTSTMSEVQAISGATGEELEELEACAREYGATTVFSASESAEALKYMALAGWDVEQSTSALGGVLNLAAASGMGLAEASDMVTDYLSAFGMEADKAAYLADLLSYAQSSSNTTAEALGEAYKNCAANLNAAGQDVETVTALLEGMANQGYKGSNAGTALAAIMRDITNAMDEGAIKIGDTSIAVMDAEGNYRDLTDIIAEVSSAVDGMGTAERAAALSTTFTADSTKGMNLILNEGIDQIAGYEEELRNASGSAEQMAEVMNDNLGGDMAAMNSAWEELGLKIYEGFENPLRSAVQFITNSVVPAVEWLIGHIPEVGTAIGIITAMISVMKWADIVEKISSVKNAVSGLTAALGGMSLPVVAVIAVIATLALAFKNLWETNEEFREAITGIWEEIKTRFDEFGQAITDRINALGFDFGSITEVMGTVWNGFCDLLAPVFEGAFQNIANILGVVLDVLTGLFDVFSGLFTGNWELVWQGIQEIFSGVCDFIVNTFLNWIETFKGLTDAVLGWFGTNWNEAWTAVQNFFTEIWNGIVSFFSGIWESITLTAQISINAVRAIITTILNAISETFRDIWNSISTSVTDVVSTIKETITGGINAAYSTVSGILDSIKEKFSSVFEGAKEIVSNAIDKIKGFFNFDWSLPSLKLPHLSITGSFSLNPTSVPSFGIEWYAKGGILSGPTIFGALGDNLLGGGEAGQEVVLPIELLRTYIREEVGNLISQIHVNIPQIDYDALAAAMSKQNITIVFRERELGRAVRAVM